MVIKKFSIYSYIYTNLSIINSKRLDKSTKERKKNHSYYKTKQYHPLFGPPSPV